MLSLLFILAGEDVTKDDGVRDFLVFVLILLAIFALVVWLWRQRR